jgi:hypothetical protein
MNQGPGNYQKIDGFSKKLKQSVNSKPTRPLARPAGNPAYGGTGAGVYQVQQGSF